MIVCATTCRASCLTAALFVALQVCVRAAPLQPGSPVAKELRGGNSPFAVDWKEYSAAGAGTGDGSQPQDVSASTDAALAAADIIGLEQRKVCGTPLLVIHFAKP